MYALKETLFPGTTRLKLLKINYRTSSCHWLIFNRSWTLRLTGTLPSEALSGKEWDPESWDGNMREDPWWSQGHWTPKFGWILFASGRSLPSLSGIGCSVLNGSSNPIPNGVGLSTSAEGINSAAQGSCHGFLGASCHARQFLFASRPINRLKSQQSRKEEV